MAPQNDDSVDRLAFRDVLVLATTFIDLIVRIGNTEVAIPRSWLLSGSDVRERGDRGSLVLARNLALGLGLPT